MAFVCPACGREFEMETEFCPACGAPMNEDAFRIQKKNEKANAVLQSMKWYKFLIYFSIPLSIVLLVINLLGTVPMYVNFDPALYNKPDKVELIRLSILIDIAALVIQLPFLLTAEIFLIKKRWGGVVSLWFIHGATLLHSVAGAVILAMGHAAGAEVISMLFPAVGIAVRLALETSYFMKRRELFSPEQK